MSTRGCIAVGTPEKWWGFYNHHDSYPTKMGEGVFSWFKSRHMTVEDIMYEYGDYAYHLTNETSDPLVIEWVYIIDEEHNIFHVLKGQKGADHKYHYRTIASLSSGDKPDWTAIEQGIV